MPNESNVKGRGSKIIFLMRVGIPFKLYGGIVEELIKRGYEVTFILDRKWQSHKIKSKHFLDFYSKYGDRSRWAIPRKDFWRHVVFPVRQLLNYRRYIKSEDQSLYFKERYIKFLPLFSRSFLKMPFVKFILASSFSDKVLRGLERSAPPDHKILNQLREINPDLLVSSIGGMRYGSVDADYFKAAQFLNIPIASYAVTWDTLSTKGLIQFGPNVLLVWNKAHAKEAIEHHEVNPEIIRMVGAVVFDPWFKTKPSGSRAEFFKKHRLDPRKKLILYLGSSGNIAVGEGAIIPELESAFRSCGEQVVEDAVMVVRPHHGNAKTFEGLMDSEKIKVIPRGGQILNDTDARQLFFDSIYYSDVVLGINTSAMIEATILNKPVIAVMREEYKETQAKAVHFKHMMEYGAIRAAFSMRECVEMICKIFKSRDSYEKKRKEFVRDFLRPQGIEVSAGSAAADEIEKLIKKT